MTKANTVNALREAIEKQASRLDDAQHLFIVSEFSHYEWNEGEIKRIEKAVESGEYEDVQDRKRLLSQRGELVRESATLFSHIMRHIKDTGDVESDPFNEFMKGSND